MPAMGEAFERVAARFNDLDWSTETWKKATLRTSTQLPHWDLEPPLLQSFRTRPATE